MTLLFAVIGWLLFAMALTTAVLYWLHDERNIAYAIALFILICFLALRL